MCKIGSMIVQHSIYHLMRKWNLEFVVVDDSGFSVVTSLPCCEETLLLDRVSDVEQNFSTKLSIFYYSISV